MDDGAALTLTCWSQADGQPLATVTARLAGCELTDFSVRGQRRPELGPYGGGRALATRALKLAGLTWKLPR
jgi:hypothetical protein